MTVDGEVADEGDDWDLRAQVNRLTRERDEAQEAAGGLLFELRKAEGEYGRLRAALEPTAENIEAYVAAIRELLPEEEPEDQIDVVLGLLVAIKARAGLP